MFIKRTIACLFISYTCLSNAAAKKKKTQSPIALILDKLNDLSVAMLHMSCLVP